MNFLKRIDTNYVVTLLFLLLSCNANFLTSNDVLWFLIVLMMFGIAVLRKLFLRKDFNKIALYSIVFLLFVSIRDVWINSLDPIFDFLFSDAIFLFKYIFLSFIFCTILKEKLMAYVVRVMTHLTLIGFFFYFIQLVAGSFLYSMMKAIDLPNNNALSNNLTGSYTNILIFTFTKDFHDLSNSGFVWEPGSYGCFLVITLMFHFFLNKFRFDRTAIILIIASITTFSTTDYISLLLLLFLAYRVRVPKFNIWLLALIVGVVVVIFTVPILGQKIWDTYQEDMGDLNHLKILERFYHHYRMEIPLNRFASMVYIYHTFGWSLILGVSNKYSLIFIKTYNVNVSNGIFDFLAKFGLVSLVFLLYKYGKICVRYVLKSEQVIYCILILLMLGFGEPIMILPIVVNFIFMPVEQVQIGAAAERERRKKELDLA